MNRSLNIDNESQWEDLVSGLLIEDGTHSASGTLSELQNSWGGGVPRDPSLEARNPSGAPSGSRAPEAPGAQIGHSAKENVKRNVRFWSQAPKSGFGGLGLKTQRELLKFTLIFSSYHKINRFLTRININKLARF